MIEKDRIDSIKNTVDIVALVKSKGIFLKKNGKGYMGLCPFHEDKKPSLSVNPQTNLFQCFGCGKGGDVIRFVELFDQVDFKEAVGRLTNGSHDIQKSPGGPEPSDPKSSGDIPYQEYMDRVAVIYANHFTQTDLGRNYLVSRGITDAGLFTKHTVGFCNGTLNDILPREGDIREALHQAGILYKNGTERYLNCVIFPVYDLNGRVITLYGRNILDTPDKKHLFLARRPTGLWNGAIVKTCSEIILTESVIDALSVQMAGFSNVISIQGTNGLTEREIMDFGIYGVRKIILFLDGDAPGRSAALRLKEKLFRFQVEIKTLPDNHDPNSYLQAFGAEQLALFLRDEKVSATPSLTAETVLPEPDGFTIVFGLRKYRVMGVEKGSRKLKATVRLDHVGKLHIDTLDFYSARARRSLALDICRVFEELPETIESDITKLMLECEKTSGEDVKEEPGGTLSMTDADRKEAETFGASPALIETILSDFQSVGYIAMTSRKRNEPLSIQILSSSGSGKTALQDAVVNFCPPEDLVKLTSLSGKALFYKEQKSLKHKVLALEEGDGAEDASYAIRSLISSGVLTNETTIKDLSTGRLTTMENRVEGPTAVFYTTTNPDVDPETKSRFFVTGIDESREQTRKILAFQREKHFQDDISQSLNMEAVINKHQNFQRLLKPMGVKNPYSGQLTYGDDRLQGRRDQPKYLNLIKSVAFLRQMQKEIK